MTWLGFGLGFGLGLGLGLVRVSLLGRQVEVGDLVCAWQPEPVVLEAGEGIDQRRPIRRRELASLMAEVGLHVPVEGVGVGVGKRVRARLKVEG